MTTNLEGWLTEASVKAWIARFKVIYADRHHDEIDALCRMALAALELKARVAELEHLQGMKAPDYLQETLKKENSDLRAQLEAAKERHFQAVYAVGEEIEKNEALQAQLTAQPDGVTVRRIIEWAVARARNRPDTNASIIADEGLDRIYGQALAAPAPAPVCVCGHAKADHSEKHGWECSEECTCLRYTPAPACGACAIEKRHSIPSADPHTCKDAPACKTCGSAKMDENGRLLHWATCAEGSKPACKTCLGSGMVFGKLTPDGYGFHQDPCPDCAKGA